MVTGNSAFGRHLCVIFKRKARILLIKIPSVHQREKDGEFQRFFLNCSVNLVSHFRCQSQINCIWKILQPGCAKCFFKKKKKKSIKTLLFLLSVCSLSFYQSKILAHCVLAFFGYILQAGTAKVFMIPSFCVIKN